MDRQQKLKELAALVNLAIKKIGSPEKLASHCDMCRETIWRYRNGKMKMKAPTELKIRELLK